MIDCSEIRSSKLWRARKTARSSSELMWRRASWGDQRPWRRNSCEPQRRQRLLTWGERGTSREGLSLRGEKNFRKWSWRGRINNLHRGIKSVKLARWSRNTCQVLVGEKQWTVISWTRDCNVSTRWGRGRVGSLGMSKEALRKDGIWEGVSEDFSKH